MIMKIAILVTVVTMLGCGSPKVEEQNPGSLVVPGFPVTNEGSLGLREADGEQNKTYSGQMLVWNQNANPDVVAEVVTTLSSSDQPLLNKYNFLKDEVTLRF